MYTTDELMEMATSFKEISDDFKNGDVTVDELPLIKESVEEQVTFALDLTDCILNDKPNDVIDEYSRIAYKAELMDKILSPIDESAITNTESFVSMVRLLDKDIGESFFEGIMQDIFDKMTDIIEPFNPEYAKIVREAFLD